MKSSRAKLSILTAVAASVIIGTASAAPVIYEPFNYSSGDTFLKNSTIYGDGLIGPWAAGNWFDNGGTGLVWGSLSTEGAAARYNGGWSSADIAISTNAPGYTNLLSDGGEMWFSMIYQCSTNDQRSYLALSSLGVSGGNGRLITNVVEKGVGIGFGRASDGKIYARVWADADGGLWPGNVTGPPPGNLTNQNNDAPPGTYFVVGHVKWGDTATDSDVVDLYLPGTDLRLDGRLVSTSEGVIADQSGIERLGFNNLSSYGIFDEIRVGATYIDVGGPPPQGTMILIR